MLSADKFPTFAAEREMPASDNDDRQSWVATFRIPARLVSDACAL